MPQPRDLARHEFAFPSKQTRPRLPLRGKRSVLPGVERPQGRDSLGPFYVWVVRTSMSLQRSHRRKLTSSSKRSRGSESLRAYTEAGQAVGLSRFCARRARTSMSLRCSIPTTRKRNPSRSLRPPFRQTPKLPVYHREHGQPNGRRLRVPQLHDLARHEFAFPSKQTRPRLPLRGKRSVLPGVYRSGTGHRSVPLLCPEGENLHEFAAVPSG